MYKNCTLKLKQSENWEFCELGSDDEFLVATTTSTDDGEFAPVVGMDCHRFQESHHEQGTRGEVKLSICIYISVSIFST